MNTKTKIGVAVISGLLLVLSFINLFSTNGLNFLVSTSEEMLVSLGILTDLKLVADATHSLPVLGTASNTVMSTLDKAFNYISLANAMVVAQIILLNLSKSFVFKSIGILCIIGLFIKKTSAHAYKILVMILLICPGLAIYINVLKYVSTEAQLDLGTSLKNELQHTQEKYNSKKEALYKKIDLKHAKQLKIDQERGRTHIGLFKRIEDDIDNTVSKSAVTIEEGVSESKNIIHFLVKKIDKMLINLIVTVLIVFLVLPLLYFYIIKLALLRLFAFELNNHNLQSVATFLGKLSNENVAKESIESFNQSNTKK